MRVIFSYQISLAVIPQGQFREDGGLGGLVLSRIFKAAHFLVQPLRVFKQVDEVEPDLPHPLGRGPYLAVKRLVRPEQILGKVL